MCSVYKFGPQRDYVRPRNDATNYTLSKASCSRTRPAAWHSGRSTDRHLSAVSSRHSAVHSARDVIDGMRMDLEKNRYQNFDELYEYCYKVAGTVALMTTPVMGVNNDYKGALEPVYRAALALGTANQLANILCDVGEDIRERSRIYLPLDELNQFGISESEVLRGMHAPSTGRIDDRWRAFMQFQITRAHKYFEVAEAGVTRLEAGARWPVWAALVLYRQILDRIEANDYDNFSKRAYVPKLQKFWTLPLAYAKANAPSVFAKSAL